MKEHTKKLNKAINNARSIAIFGHRNPDGDCIGSMLGWGVFLETLGKKVEYFVPTQPIDSFNFLPDISKIQVGFNATKNYDLLFFLDTATHDGQLGTLWTKNPKYFEKHTNKIVIDHHISNTGYGDYNIIKSDSSSVCEIVTNIIKNTFKGKDINKKIANYLLLGISTDTGHFKRATSTETFSSTSRLLSHGGDLNYISNNMYRSNSLSQVQFTQRILSRIQQSGNIIYTWYTQKERKEYGLENKFVEQALGIMSSIDHNGVFLFFKGQELDETPLLRCSFRTKNENIDVAAIASHFHGGGHRAAAGSHILIKNNFEETIIDTVQKVSSLIKLLL